MKTRLLIIIGIAILSGFIIWSLADMQCKPCIIPSDVDPNQWACPSMCTPEPRWYSWFR